MLVAAGGRDARDPPRAQPLSRQAVSVSSHPENSVMDDAELVAIVRDAIAERLAPSIPQVARLKGHHRERADRGRRVDAP